MKNILIILSILIIFSVGWMLYLNNQKEKDENFSNTTIYTNSQYTLRLLPGYKASIYSDMFGESDIMIQRDGDDNNFPDLHITYFLSESASFDVLKSSYKLGGFVTKKEKEIMIDGVKAYKIDGIYNRVSGKMFATRVLFEHNNNMFEIYINSETKEEYRELLKMLNTLDLK